MTAKKNEENKSEQTNPPAPPTDETNPPAPPTGKPARVQVICEGTLGHLLLKKGETTDDEAYVALLKTKRGQSLVQKVA